MTSTADQRQAAAAKIDELIRTLKAQPDGALSVIVEESEELARAVAAFHLEGIRFRMFNVDRLVTRAGTAVPAPVPALLEDIRHHLEAAGFHTRSHQAPT